MDLLMENHALRRCYRCFASTVILVKDINTVDEDDLQVSWPLTPRDGIDGISTCK